MDGFCKRRALGLMIVLSMSGAAFCGGPYAESAEKEMDDVKRIEVKPMSLQPTSMNKIGAGEKKPFEFRRGDSVLSVGGKSVTESRFAKNATMLNKCLPDETWHFRQTLDADFGYAFGEKKFGHKAVELGTTVRFKTIWGKIGYAASADKNIEFKVVDAALGEHSHPSSRSLMWIKHAWLQASLNSVFDLKTKRMHYFKIGMFPFHLGRGIALGPIYGIAPRSFLAIYTRDTDYSPAGMLLTGELIEDTLSYDVYYSKLEDKSASFNDVFNSNKEKVLGRRTTPWSGSAKDSDLFAARFKLTPFDDSKGKLDLEPYIMYNAASDQKVEFEADSRSILGAVGMAAEYAFKNFEFGGELVFNYGSERLFAIDRNRVLLINEKYDDEKLESVREVYSHVLYVKGDEADPDNPLYDGKKVVVNPNTETAVINSRNSACGCGYNGVEWAPDPVEALPPSSSAGDDVTMFKNADDRYRRSYKNNYNGWAFVIDAAYDYKKMNLKGAATYGFASGDENPHACERDKNYNGFVGLYELYSGKRVPSIFILDARKTRRPLTLRKGDTDATAYDTSFTDLHYFGTGFTWKPKCLKKYDFKINSNVLFFWKDHSSRKYDRVAKEVCACSNADKFLGTEFNIITKYNLLKDLSVIGHWAIFFPGSYYSDVKGVPLNNKVFKELEKRDLADLPSTRYGLGDDTAFYSEIHLEYTF